MALPAILSRVLPLSRAVRPAMTEQKMRGTISICMVFTNRTPMGLSSSACSLKPSPSPIPVSMPSRVFNQSGRRVQIRQGLKTNPWNSMTPMSLFSVCDGKGALV
ncbi:hypothetical protein D3C79_366740 [compost metagenome]